MSSRLRRRARQALLAVVALALLALAAGGCAAATTTTQTDAGTDQTLAGSSTSAAPQGIEKQDAFGDIVSTEDWAPVDGIDLPGAADLLLGRVTLDEDTLKVHLTTAGPVPSGSLETSEPAPATSHLSMLSYVIILSAGGGSPYEIDAVLQKSWLVKIGRRGETTLLNGTPQIEGADITIAVPLSALQDLPSSFGWCVYANALVSGGQTGGGTWYLDNLPITGAPGRSRPGGTYVQYSAVTSTTAMISTTTSSSTTTTTAGSPASQYANRCREVAKAIGESVDIIDRWIAGTASDQDAVSAASSMRTEYATAKEVKPPAGTSKAHGYLLNALKQYDQGAALILDAVKNKSKHTIDAAQAAFARGKPNLQKCLDRLADL